MPHYLCTISTVNTAITLYTFLYSSKPELLDNKSFPHITGYIASINFSFVPKQTRAWGGVVVKALRY